MASIMRMLYQPMAQKKGLDWPSMTPIKQAEPAPQRDYEAEQAAKDAAEKQRQAANLAKGAASTILTGGAGLTENPTVQRKQLFGQ